MNDLVIKNAQCFLPDGLTNIDIGITNGKITAIGESLAGKNEEDASGLTILPGIIDSQVHFRDPGLTHKEDLETGSRSAAYGGVTAFFEMPNTSPPTTTIKSIEEKVALGQNRSLVDYAFFIGADGTNTDELIKADGIPGCCGIKIFLGSSTGPLLFNDEEKILNLFKNIPKDFPVSIHSENELILNERKHIWKEATTAHAHPEWRNVESALSSTQMIVGLAAKAEKPIHVLHITTKEEIEFLKDYKDLVTVEVTPQHLTLSSPTCYDELGTYAQMNPPIRGMEHQAGLWHGVNSGVIDIIGSDHAPHTKEEKGNGYPGSPSGMPGVQTLLPLMLNHVHNKMLTLEKMVDLTCINPAKLFRLKNKGHIRIGRDADLTLVDLNQSSTIHHNDMKSKCGWTPFDGKEVSNTVMGTLVGGKWAYHHKHGEQTIGSPLNFG